MLENSAYANRWLKDKTIMNYKTKQGAIISDDGYTMVLKDVSLGYGWQATLWNNDVMVWTRNHT